MEMLYLVIALFLLLIMVAGLWRVLRGPTSADRMLTAQLFGTTAVACVLLLAKAFNYPLFTCFKAGANTKAFGAKSHDYPEEIMIIKGRLFDEAFNKWLEPGVYASRPSGEVHGPFIAEEEGIVLEMSYPSQSI